MEYDSEASQNYRPAGYHTYIVGYDTDEIVLNVDPATATLDDVTPFLNKKLRLGTERTSGTGDKAMQGGALIITTKTDNVEITEDQDGFVEYFVITRLLAQPTTIKWYWI